MARTIQSPGVEINEIDLSSRTVFPIGTNILIQGFSANGPTDETLNVSTFSEFETIYGSPTNAAERYFYHTVKSTFNSPANIMVCRLPYGNQKGETFADELYSALVFPVSGDDHAAATLTGSYLTDKVASTASDGDGAGETTLGSVSDSTQLQFGAPIRIDLLPGEYQALKNGEVEFDDNCLLPLNSAGNVDYTSVPDPHDTVALKFDDLPAYDSSGAARKLGDFKKRMSYAGMVLVNKAQSTINTYFEGYYIALGDNNQFAIADGSTPEASQFDSIQGIKTFGNAGTYFDAPTARLNFETTAHTVTGAQGSLSEVFENIPSFDIATEENKDTIGIGVFKMRKSIYATDTTMLDFTLDEGHIGSLDAYKQIANISGGKPKSFYLETVDTASTLLSVYVNKAISEQTGTFLTDTNNPTIPNTSITFHPEAQKYAWGTGSFQEEVPASAKKSIGSIVAKIERNFEKLQNLDEYDLDITLDAGLSTINTYVQYKQEQEKYKVLEAWLEANKHANAQAAADTLGYANLRAAYLDNAATGLDYPEDTNINVSFDDEVVLDISGMYGNTLGESSPDVDLAADWEGLQSAPTWEGQTAINSWKAVTNSFIVFAQNRRKDHMTILDPLRYIFVQGRNGITMKDTSKNFSQHVFYPLKHLLSTTNTNYAATYGNWLKQYDAFTDKNFWAPPSGVIGSSYARNDSVYQPWFAPAGFTRGLITNALEVSIRPNQKQRDQFYKISCNPIAFFPGDGYVIFGQKTLQAKPSAFDRINVRRMFLYLEKAVRKTIKYYVFEPNTFSTRQNILAVLTPIFQRVKSTQGCYDYLIVCDERNNPPVVIDNNELVVDIYIKPVRAAEFILCNFYATRTDQNFSELIG